MARRRKTNKVNEEQLRAERVRQGGQSIRKKAIGDINDKLKKSGNLGESKGRYALPDGIMYRKENNIARTAREDIQRKKERSAFMAEQEEKRKALDEKRAKFKEAMDQYKFRRTNGDSLNNNAIGKPFDYVLPDRAKQNQTTFQKLRTMTGENGGKTPAASDEQINKNWIKNINKKIEAQNKQDQAYDAAGNDVRDEKLALARYDNAVKQYQQQRQKEYDVSGDFARNEKQAIRKYDQAMADYNKAVEEWLNKKQQQYDVTGGDVRAEKQAQHRGEQFADKYAQAVQYIAGDYDYGTWTGGQTEEVKKALQEGNAQKMRRLVDQMIEQGAFDDKDDVRLWSNKHRAEMKVQYQGDVEKYNADIDRLQNYTEESRWDKLLDLYTTPETKELWAAANGDDAVASANAWQRLEEIQYAERSPYDGKTAIERLNDNKEKILNLLSSGEKMGPDDLHREVYDAINGRGAYDKTVKGMTDQEKDKLDAEIDDAFMYAYDPKKAEKDLLYAQDMARYTQGRIEAIDAQDEWQKNYTDMITAGAKGDTTWDPQKAIDAGMISESGGRQADAIDMVYLVLGNQDKYADDSVMGKAYGAALMMNQQEKDIFISLYNDGKKNEAWAFYEGISPMLNQAWAREEQIALKDMATRFPVASSAATIATTALQPVEYIMNIPSRIQALFGGKIGAADPYSGNYQLTRFKQGIRQEVQQNAGDWGWVYSGVMSGADSALNVAIGKGLGLTGDALKYGTLALFASEAFETSLQNSMATGDRNYAYNMIEAYLDAAIETATEIWSVENLMADPTNLLTYLGKIAISEPSEEVVGAIVEPYIKGLVGHQHEYEAREQEILVNKGYYDNSGNWVEIKEGDVTAARKQAMREWNHNIRMAAQEALISVGPSMVYGAAQNAVYNNQLTQMGRNVNAYEQPGQSFIPEGAQAEEQADQAGAMSYGLNQMLEKARQTKSYSEAQKIATEIEKRREEGKNVKDRDVGRLAAALLQENGIKARELSAKAVESKVKAMLSGENAEEKAQLVAKAVTEGEDSLTMKERRTLNQDAETKQIISDLKEKGNNETKTAINEAISEATKEIQEERKSISEIAQVNNRQLNETVKELKTNIEKEDLGSWLASEEDTYDADGNPTRKAGEVLRFNAEAGTKTYGQLTSVKDGKVYLQNANGGVDLNEIKATTPNTAYILLNYQNNRGVYTDDYVNTLLNIQNKGQVTDAVRFMMDAERTRWAAYLNKQMPKTSLPENVAREIWTESKAEAGQQNAENVHQANFRGVGKGTATFQDAEYGTKAWNQKMKALDADTRNAANYVAQIAKISGMDLRLMTTEEIQQAQKGMDAALIYGNEAESGIILNLDAWNYQLDKNGEREKTTKHNIVVAMGHEMTHWLKANSPAAYYQLQEYIVSEMSQNEAKFTSRLQNKIAAYRQNGKQLNMMEAIDEVVADACDQMLGSEQFKQYLQENKPKLFKEVQNFVQSIVDRFKRAISTMSDSASRDAQVMMGRHYNELAKLWLGAYDQALTGKISEMKNNLTAKDIQNMSMPELDNAYEQALQNNDKETMQQLVYEAGERAGYTIKAYHGTGRADRVGTVFRAERATSGPFAYFTDNRDIAENYSRDKKDTSLDYEEGYEDYHTQFRTTIKGKNVPISKLWNTLSFAERQKITERAKHITLDDDEWNIIYDENARYGVGNFTDYERKLHGWNSIETLIDGWLDGGTLFNREADFLQVLKLAGIENVTYNDPNMRVEKVYDTLLKIQNPFDVFTMYNDKFLNNLETWWKKQDRNMYERENMGADMWDKNGISVEEWIEYGRDEVERGRTGNWTRIPDGVSAYLKEKGYDGIKDHGGKGNGIGHTVWIPFSSEQVKSADPVTYDDNGEVIPLSERFNENNEDIRYSQAETNYKFDADFEKCIRLYTDNYNEFKKKFGDSEIVIGETFQILQDIGLLNKPMVLDQEHLEKAFGQNAKPNHKLTAKSLVEIIRKANNPVAIIKSRATGRENDSIVIVVDHKLDNDIVIVPIRVSALGYINQMSVDVNFMASAHSRSNNNIFNLLKDAVETELEGKKPGIYYTNKNKADFLKREGVQFPSSFKNNGLMHRITDNPDFVKQTYENKENTDKVMDKIRSSYSMAESNMDVNMWMQSLTPGLLNTEHERQLLQAYKDLRITRSLTQKRIDDYQTKIKKMEARERLTPEERAELVSLKNKLKLNEEKLERLDDELYEVTSNEGYAGMMYKMRTLMSDFIEGKTQAQVMAAVDSMTNEAERVAREIAAREKELKRQGENSAVKVIRSELGKRGLSTTVKALVSEYNTSMTESELRARMAEIVLQMVNGQDATQTIKALAEDMMSNQRMELSEELAYVKANRRVFTISEDDVKQLMHQNHVTGMEQMTPKQLKRMMNQTVRDLNNSIRGSGITFRMEGNANIFEQWNELRDKNMGLPDLYEQGNTNGASMAGAIADWISKQTSSNTEELGVNAEDTALFIQSMAQMMLNEEAGGLSKEQMLEKIRSRASAIDKALGVVQDVKQTAEGLQIAAKKTKGWNSFLQRDINMALDYFNKMAQQAAQQERQKVRKSLIETLKSEHTKELLEQQERYEDLMKRDKKARELHDENEKLRKQINTNISRIKNLLINETDRKNIPEEAKPLARMVARMIAEHDYIGYRRVLFAGNQQLDDFMKRLKKMDALDGGFDADQDLNWLVIEAPNEEDNDYTVRDAVMQALMDIEQGLLEYRNAEGHGVVTLEDRRNGLEKVQKAVSKINDVIRARSEAIIDGRKWQVYELAEMMEQDMANSRFKGEYRGRNSRAKNMFINAVGYGNITPEYFIKNLRNRVMSMLQRGINDAENRGGLLALEAQKRIDKIVEETGFESWDGQEMHKLQVAGGREIEITTEQMMALYATWMRERNQLRPEDTAHLMRGGFVLAETNPQEGKARRVKISNRPVRMSYNQLQALEKQLTTQQVAYVKAIVEYMSTDMAEIGNEASMKAYGIKKFTEQFYYPIKSWSGVLNKKSSAGAGMSNNQNTAMQQSFTKRLTANANNAIEISDFTPTAMKHIVGMINFNTVGPAVENINKVLNQKLEYGTQTEEEDTRFKRNMRAAFAEAYGENASRYLEQYMKDINGGITQMKDNSLKGKLLGVFRKGAVAGSLSVAAQQPLSYIRAAMQISPKYLTAAIMPQHWGKIHQEMLEHSGVAVIKDMGKFDMNQGRSMVDFISPEVKQNRAKETMKWITEKSTILPQKMDEITWGRLWIACKMEQQELHPEMDPQSKDFLDMVGVRFNDLMRMTQVYDSVLVRSQNMRSQNIAVKTMTSFMAEPTLSLNVLADAVMNAKEKGGMKRVGEAVATFLLSAVMQALVKAGMSTGRNPDEKKTWEEQFLARWATQFFNEADPLTLIPGFSQIIQAVKNGELADDAMGVIGKLKSIVQTTAGWATGSKTDVFRNVEDTVGQITQIFTGVPLKNLMRDTRAMINFFTPGKYAMRDTSGAVIKYGILDSLMTSDSLTGTINSYLNMMNMGYDTGVSAYAKRVYEAKKAGNDKLAQELTDYYVKGKSKAANPEDALRKALNTSTKKDDTISAEQKAEQLSEGNYGSMTQFVTEQYAAGKIDRKTAEELYKKENPTATHKDMIKALDKVDWDNQGNELAYDQKNYTNYTPLYVAIEKNSADSIRKAVSYLMENEYNAKDIKTQVNTQVKKLYAKADSNEKVKLRDAMQKAYRALGYTAEDANKTIEKWK